MIHKVLYMLQAFVSHSVVCVMRPMNAVMAQMRTGVMRNAMRTASLPVLMDMTYSQVQSVSLYSLQKEG